MHANPQRVISLGGDCPLFASRDLFMLAALRTLTLLSLFQPRSWIQDSHEERTFHRNPVCNLLIILPGPTLSPRGFFSLWQPQWWCENVSQIMTTPPWLPYSTPPYPTHPSPCTAPHAMSFKPPHPISLSIPISFNHFPYPTTVYPFQCLFLPSFFSPYCILVYSIIPSTVPTLLYPSSSCPCSLSFITCHAHWPYPFHQASLPTM